MEFCHKPGWARHMLKKTVKSRMHTVAKAQEGLLKDDGGSGNGSGGGGNWEMHSLEEAHLGGGGGGGRWEMHSLEEVLPPPLSVENLACILHKCRKERNLGHAMHLHAYMCISGLEAHPLIGNLLVSMLVEVGSMPDAQQVFDRLVYQNEYSWNSLMAGYIKQGESQLALTLYQKMQDHSLHPSEYTLVVLLKACAKLKDIKRGCQIHADIAKKGLERDVFVGSTLVDMYSKCGFLQEAQEVFNKLPVRDAVVWNTLISAYVKHRRGEEALQCFQHMQLEGVSPDAITFLSSLKACGSIGATDKGQEIHAEISKKGFLESDVSVGNALVDMYAKCGLLEKAQEVFDKLPVRNIVSGNSLIAGYAKHGRGEEALNCFKQMQLEGVSPNAITFACTLQACGSIGATDQGEEIHAEIARKGFLERDAFLGNALVDMYVKCGLLAKAQKVFDKLRVRDAVSWTALITGYAKHGHGEEALNFFEQMQVEGVSPDAITLLCCLKACGSTGAVNKGREIHAEISRNGLLERDLAIGNALIDMYAKCGLLAKTREVFDELPRRDTVTWNALIGGYVKHGHAEEALNCFDQMQLEGISPDAVTFLCSLNACGSIGATEKGGELHAEIARIGLLERDLSIGNSLVDMYAKCGLLAKAQEVFDKLPVRDAVSWNALMTGYATHGRGQEALKYFGQMQVEGVSPTAVTFVCSLKACGSIGDADKGQKIHAEIARKGLLEKEIAVGNALVDMYANCGFLVKAQEVFNNLPVRDGVSWNALITGYVNHGHNEEALNCFEKMQREGVPADTVTFVCILKACGSLGAADRGGEIHDEIVRHGLFKRDLVVGNAVVDMYANCGLLAKAQEVFDKLPVRDIISWTALIAGYAQLGECENVFHIFNRMRGEGQKPNLVTLVSVLNACSHAGLVDKGQMYFEAMSQDYGITSALEHHTCLVDILGRAGQLDKAVTMIKKMPFHPNLVMWLTVLSACRKWGNVELGRQAFEHLVQLDEKNAAAYVCMSNIYADANMLKEAQNVEAMRVQKSSMKEAML